MADKTSLIVTSTDTNGKSFSKTYTSINPNASKGELRTFAQGLNSLTKNTYEGAAVVKRTEIPTDPTDPCFVVTPTVIPHAKIMMSGAVVYGMFSYEGDARTPTLSGKRPEYAQIQCNESGFTITNTLSYATFGGSVDCTFTLTLPAAGSYKAVSVDVTITNANGEYIVDIN